MQTIFVGRIRLKKQEEHQTPCCFYSSHNYSELWIPNSGIAFTLPTELLPHCISKSISYIKQESHSLLSYANPSLVIAVGFVVIVVVLNFVYGCLFACMYVDPASKCPQRALGPLELEFQKL